MRNGRDEGDAVRGNGRKEGGGQLGGSKTENQMSEMDVLGPKMEILCEQVRTLLFLPFIERRLDRVLGVGTDL